MIDLLSAILLLIVGAIITQCLNWYQKRRNILDCKICCDSSYCPDGDSAIVTFVLTHKGSEIIKDLHLRFECKGEDSIQGYCFYVDEQLKCDRLDQASNNSEKESDTSFRSTWAYLNPKDVIELEVHLAPGAQAENSTLEIDGEKVMVQRKRMKLNCEC